MIVALFQDLFVLVASIGADYFRRRPETSGKETSAVHVDTVVRDNDPPTVPATKILMGLAAEQPRGS